MVAPYRAGLCEWVPRVNSVTDCVLSSGMDAYSEHPSDVARYRRRGRKRSKGTRYAGRVRPHPRDDAAPTREKSRAVGSFSGGSSVCDRSTGIP